MDIDGVALVVGAGKAQFGETPCIGLLTVPFAELACARLFNSAQSKNTLIADLTGSGIGREVALTLVSRGARALICGDINLEAAQETADMSCSRKAEHLTDYRAHAFHVDVTNENSVQQMANEANSLFGRIDYFVNTAGVSSGLTADRYTLQSNQMKMEIHFLMIHCLLHFLR